MGMFLSKSHVSGDCKLTKYQMTKALLKALDGLQSRSNVFFLCTSNSINTLVRS